MRQRINHKHEKYNILPFLERAALVASATANWSRTRKREHITHVLKKLHLLPVRQRIDHKHGFILLFVS